MHQAGGWEEELKAICGESQVTVSWFHCPHLDHNACIKYKREFAYNEGSIVVYLVQLEIQEVVF